MNSQSPTANWLSFLSIRFDVLSRSQFSGRFTVQGKSGSKWQLFFQDGQLIWACGGVHPLRRWQRVIGIQCPHLSPQNVIGSGQPYQQLIRLLNERQLTIQQATAVVADVVLEVMVDILQQASESIRYGCEPGHDLDSLPISFTVQSIWTHAQHLWQGWQQAGASDYSPNGAPVIKRPDLLKSQVSEPVYQTLLMMLNGKQTLRDLALVMKQELPMLTRSLLPFLKCESVVLLDIPDLAPVVTAPQPKPVQKPLIACIDDSPLVCQRMQQIVASGGYRFVGLQDAVSALPILLQQKPDFIFLDLVMPVVNGYEICTQIRRISAFKSIPIVILTGNDGFVDRVRAKLVGSDDFLTKPIESDQVLHVLHKHFLGAAAAPAKHEPLFPNRLVAKTI